MYFKQRSIKNKLFLSKCYPYRLLTVIIDHFTQNYTRACACRFAQQSITFLNIYRPASQWNLVLETKARKFYPKLIVEFTDLFVFLFLSLSLSLSFFSVSVLVSLRHSKRRGWLADTIFRN